MANYRDALDALNALVDEQRKTNELLEKLVEQKESNITEVQEARPEHTQIRRRGRKAQ